DHRRSHWLHAAVAMLFLAAGSAGTLLLLRWSGQTEIASGAPPRNIQQGPSEIADALAAASEHVREVGVNMAPAPRSALSEVEMLRIQSTAFEQVIRKLQDELARRHAEQAETQRMLESLRQEVTELRDRLDRQPRTESATK